MQALNIRRSASGSIVVVFSFEVSGFMSWIAACKETFVWIGPEVEVMREVGRDAANPLLAITFGDVAKICERIRLFLMAEQKLYSPCEFDLEASSVCLGKDGMELGFTW
jgi:hypothetical protein